MIKVKNKKSKELFQFVCLSDEHPGYFIYKLYFGEELCEYGHISKFQPIGMTWEEIQNDKKI